jgi:prepilin-type N-terminal cleavage/methylation domain-containing protein
MDMKRSRPVHSAFTLVELITVIIIVAIIATVALFISLSAKVWVKESTLLHTRLGMSLELPQFS